LINKQAIFDYVDGLMARSTPEHPVWNYNVLAGNNPRVWNYVDGCMMKALMDIYAVCEDEKHINYVNDFVGSQISDDGAILGFVVEDYNSDSVNQGKVLFPLYAKFGTEKYRKAMDLLYSQLSSHPRVASGNFWHKQIYPKQIWLDGLYMTMPFYAQYETLYNRGLNYSDIVSQFRGVRETMRDDKTGLLYHGYDETRSQLWANPKNGLSKNFWARSLGWYIMALLDTAEQLDDKLSQNGEKECLIGYLKELSDTLLTFADPESGMLWQVVDCQGHPGNYLETSASCALAYTLMKAARLGFIPTDYFAKGRRIFDSVYEQKFRRTENGSALGDICLVAGLGGMPGKGHYKVRDGSYEYYISEPKVDDDAKGIAPFLMSFAEILRRQEEN
jgi:unsaturated rhamnogalacturonyl hydrolase